ncbi:dihydrolipoyl dehydrogenase [Candidatus Latescibacterota bacterium]
MKNKSLVILGSGPGGYVAAIRAAQMGLSVIVVEREGLGGVCLQHGCIPMKALLRSVDILQSARDASSFGVICSNVGFDFSRMMKRKNDIVAINEKGIESLFKANNIKLIRGTGRLLSPLQLEITDNHGSKNRIDADYVIIATGSSSLVPPFITLDQTCILGCEGALALNSLPSNMVILGGGILGCEFASLFNTLDVNVTIIEKLQTLIPTWDRDLAKRVTASFRKRSIDVRVQTAVKRVKTDNSAGSVKVTLSTGETIITDSCVVALGRKPNIENIGLEESGIALWNERYRGIQVNDHLQTNIPTVYAVGDVTGIRPLAHVASAQGIAAVEHIFGMDSVVRYDAVPDCFWAQPELGSVGITEQDAKKQGLDVGISRFSYRSMGIAHVLGETDGFVKVITEKGTGKVLGIHICGHSAPEMVAEASVIVTNGLTVEDVKNTIHAHPTMGEILKEGVLSVKDLNIHG